MANTTRKKRRRSPFVRTILRLFFILLLLSMLAAYISNQVSISSRRAELQTLNEQIEAMNYGHGDGLGHTQGRVSNKTLFIALNYEEQAERLNAQASSEIAEELFELKQKQKRLKYYIALLDKRQSEVVRLLYLEEVAPNEVAEQLGVTYRTVDRVRKAAILALAEMYAYADSFKL